MKLTRTAIFAVILILFLSVSVFALGTTRVGSRASYTPSATTGTAYLYTANSLTSGILFNYQSTGTLTGSLLSMTANGLTSGNFISLTGDDDTLNGGAYLKCIGGTNHATTVYTIGESGAVTAVGGDFQINSTGTTKKFKVTAASGNTEVVGTLAVTGASTLTGNVTASGTLAVTGTSAFTGAVACTSTLTSKRVINTTALDTETTKTMDPATDLSGTVYISAAAGATTVTLPAVATSGGASWEFIRSGAGNFIITGPAGTLVTNDASTAVVNATTVTYSAAGHIIGSSALVYCDGAKWYIVNQGGTAIAAT